MTEPVVLDGDRAFVWLQRGHDVLLEVHMLSPWQTRWRSLPRAFGSEMQLERHGGSVSRLRAAWRATVTVARIARGW